MKVTIETVNGRMASFHCAAGRGIGCWQGSPPRVGETYVVEISIQIPLTLGVNLFHTNEPAALRVQDEGWLEIVGETVEVYPGGPSGIRVCDGVLDGELLMPVGTRVLVRTRPEELTLWDTDI